MSNINNSDPESVLKYADGLARHYGSLLDELAVWKYRVHSTMFVASATILTLVCSLHTPEPDTCRIACTTGLNHLTEWIGIATILLCGICLLALLGALSQNIFATCREADIVSARFEAVKSILSIPESGVLSSGGECRSVISVERPVFFSICEWVSYISFALLVVCLVVQYLVSA